MFKLIMEFYARNKMTPKVLAEAEGAKAYVHAVKDARLAVMGLTGYFIALFALMLGLALLALGISYKAGSVETVATTAVVLGAVLFFVPLIGLIVAFSQRLLIKVAKVDKVVDKVVQDANASQSTNHGTPLPV